MTTPLPPPIEVPQGFEIPNSYLELPPYRHPWWVDPPLRREDIPALQNKDKTESAQQDPGGDEPAPKAAAPERPAAPTFQEVQSITIPLIEQEVPVPKTEILVTAVSTATVASVASVGATLMANSLFKRVLSLAKPVTKFIVKKLAKARKKPAPLTWGRARRLERRHYRGRRSGNRVGA